MYIMYILEKTNSIYEIDHIINFVERAKENISFQTI